MQSGVRFTLLTLMLITPAAQAQFFGPLEYLQASDVPDGFCEDCELEDFEDNAIDPFLQFDCGEILGPNTADPRIPGKFITDSVDGDDGQLDGTGTGGHSYFCVDPSDSITIRFARPVAAAGVVWTDGDRNVSASFSAELPEGVTFESEPTPVADASFFGETAEDRFFGYRVPNSDGGIASITLTNVGRGAGIEIDHVRWDAKPIVEERPITVDNICNAVTANQFFPEFDQNGDNVVSLEDVHFLLDAQGTGPGDTDLDGDVDFDDFLTLAANFEMEKLSHSGGDLDCSGRVDFDDFLNLAQRFAPPETVGAATVPEPNSLLLASAALAILGLRKRSASVQPRPSKLDLRQRRWG